MFGNERVNAVLATVMLVIGGVACSTLSKKPPLTWHLILEVEGAEADRPAAVKQTVAVIKKRLDAIGIARFEVAPVPRDRIVVVLPDTPDHERLKRVVTAGGKLELTPVVSSVSPAPVEAYSLKQEAELMAFTKNGQVYPFEMPQTKQPAFLVLEKNAIVTGEDLRSANAVVKERPDHYSIVFSLRSEGADRLGDWTKSHINSYLAIVLNGTVVSAPYIRGEIRDTGEINGNFSKTEAEDLALVLTAGALPAPIKLVEEKAGIF